MQEIRLTRGLDVFLKSVSSLEISEMLLKIQIICGPHIRHRDKDLCVCPRTLYQKNMYPKVGTVMRHVWYCCLGNICRQEMVSFLLRSYLHVPPLPFHTLVLPIFVKITATSRGAQSRNPEPSLMSLASSSIPLFYFSSIAPGFSPFYF